MVLWTKCPIKVTNGYGGGRAIVAIPDKIHAGQWSYPAHEFDRKYADVLTTFKTEFIILFTTLANNGEEWLTNTFRNGVAIQYPFTVSAYASNKKHDPQVHVYPLIMLPWFQKKYRSEKSEKDPILFVDGKLVKWTKDVCFNCPQILDRSFRQCHAVHESCTRPMVSEKELPTPDWLAAHATATDNIDGFTFKPIKDMAVVLPFEVFTIYALTTDEAKVRQSQQKRSDSASMAAQSRFVKDVACKQCLRINYCGFCCGGSWCEGLHLAEDYDYIHEKCEPWMAHVMLLTQNEPIDAKLIRAWTSARTPAYVLRPYLGTPSMDHSWYGKYKTDPRCVVLMRGCGNNPSTYVPYLYACKLLNVQPVSKWSELPPSYKTSKSLRAVTYGLASGRIHNTDSIRSGWGARRSVEVTDVQFEAGKFVTLEYSNSRRDWSDRHRLNEKGTFYSDLLGMPGMSGEAGSLFSAKRQLENSVFREAVIARRFNVTIDEVKKACRKFGVKSVKLATHPPAVYEWLEERSKERCRQKRRSSKKPATLTAGDQATAT